MGLSKSTRIKILLAIDSVFFLIELVTGYAVHSLALVADSFHMLNDVLSLLVGLWAVKVAQEKPSSNTYTYGWQRAETLGALVNGVFLVALCLSIFLEAIQRFVEPQVVSQPLFVMIVGCFGLASNIVGLFLFHDHGHSHGGHSHGHSHGAEETDPLLKAEQGRATHTHDETDAGVADEQGNVADVLPQSRVGPWPTTGKSRSPSSDTTAVEESAPAASSYEYKHKHKKTRSRSRTASGVDEIYVSPNAFRRSIIESGRLDAIDSGEDETEDGPTEEASTSKATGASSSHAHSTLNNGTGYGSIAPTTHHSHKHAQPKSNDDGHGHGGHGHSHDLNMQGVFLHVLGDALGNIGVIASALIIWLAPWPWRFYFDPAISLVITVIILCSAIPLCKAASRILLQAVPLGLSIEDIKDDIESLPGVVSAHHLHVWQLSDTKLVASLHIQVGFDFKGEGSARYMQLAHSIRECLHDYGIHSSTIQPEFCLDPDHDHAVNGSATTATVASHSHGSDGAGDDRGGHRDVSPQHRAVSGAAASKTASKANSVRGDADACLLECGSACGNDKSCCPPPSAAVNGRDKKEHGDASSHDHDHDHDH